eukprot:Skav223042  [mRNA]  locus=scaffold1069:153031:154716:+ [translate_table: standard]
MPQVSLYDVLLVDQNATLDEIKLAFKKRALQVHPDKGGSKEAFHLVYQALETLADPEARRKYDQGADRCSAADPEESGQKKKTGRKRGAPPRQAPPSEPPTSSKKARSQKAEFHAGTDPQAACASQSNHPNLLSKIHDLLKQLPRDVRNDVISKHFSQKQRLILEKWMVEMLTEGGRQGSLVSAESVTASVQSGTGTDGHSALALPSASFGQNKSRRCMTKRKKESSVKKARSTSGYLRKDSDSDVYRAGICFDSFEMNTKKCDLQTGLEFLMVLTAVKQKMRDAEFAGPSFEERLQGALMSSAKEHGKHLADLKLTFLVVQAAGFFIGTDLRTRSVQSVEQLGRMRRCLEPFRQYAKNVGSRSLYWQHSPAHLQDAWERFQTAAADAWEIAGADRAIILEKIRARYQGRADVRNAKLQQWERAHMALHDTTKNRPRIPKQVHATKAFEGEPQSIALHTRKRRSRRCPSELRLLALKRLLVRWGRMLKLEARLVDKERRRVLQQRIAHLRKAREERSRLDALNRKRLREERLRREALRKRMRSDLTMDDLLGDRCDCDSQH